LIKDRSNSERFWVQIHSFSSTFLTEWTFFCLSLSTGSEMARRPPGVAQGGPGATDGGSALAWRGALTVGRPGRYCGRSALKNSAGGGSSPPCFIFAFFFLFCNAPTASEARGHCLRKHGLAHHCCRCSALSTHQTLPAASRRSLCPPPQEREGGKEGQTEARRDGEGGCAAAGEAPRSRLAVDHGDARCVTARES
jgi:hypothetical protein